MPKRAAKLHPRPKAPSRSWFREYDKVVEYKAKFPDRDLLALNYSAAAKWCQAQHVAYLAGTLSPVQVAVLEGLGLKMDRPLPRKRAVK